MQREELERRLGRKMRPGVSNDPRILVSPEDAWLLEWKWTILSMPRHTANYAIHGNPNIYLHRVIMDFPQGRQVDHINRDGLDNRRCNLRLADNSQNHGNVGLRSDGTSGYKGVQLSKSGLQWAASIGHKGRVFISVTSRIAKMLPAPMIGRL